MTLLEYYFCPLNTSKFVIIDVYEIWFSSSRTKSFVASFNYFFAYILYQQIIVYIRGLKWFFLYITLLPSDKKMHRLPTVLVLSLILVICLFSHTESASCSAYNPTFYTCCNGVLTFGSGKSCCATTAYDPTFYTCCNGVLTFGSGKSCCGTTAYDPTFYTCCKGALTFGRGLACGK